jgi:recombination protein RecT
MSTNALKQIATGNKSANAQVPAKKPQTLAEMLMGPKMQAQLAAALPNVMTAERFARVVLTEIRKNPKLGEATPQSFFGAVMQCAQLGLEPGGALGHCYLLPFENRRKGIVEVQFILGYKGMLDLARRSGQILSIEARAVYEHDTFHVSFGLDPDLKHTPNWDVEDRGALKFVYAVAKLKDGGTQFEVMSGREINKIRDGSQGYQTAVRFNRTDSPWMAAYEEMAKKTVLRRIFKYLPVSIESQRAAGQDEAADRGETVTVDLDTGEIFGGEARGEGSQDQDQGDEPAGIENNPSETLPQNLGSKGKQAQKVAPGMEDHADFLAGMESDQK